MGMKWEGTSSPSQSDARYSISSRRSPATPKSRNRGRGRGRGQDPANWYANYSYEAIKQRLAEVQHSANAVIPHGAANMPSSKLELDATASSVQHLQPGQGRANTQFRTSMTRDPSLALLLPLLILLSTLLFLLVFFLVFLILVRRRRGRGIALQDHEGPLDLSREEEFDGEGGIVGVEERWLEQQDEAVQQGYQRAKRKFVHIAESFSLY
jgi:hypothetical protein